MFSATPETPASSAVTLFVEVDAASLLVELVAEDSSFTLTTNDCCSSLFSLKPTVPLCLIENFRSPVVTLSVKRVIVSVSEDDF